jgi:hypothetical protein
VIRSGARRLLVLLGVLAALAGLVGLIGIATGAEAARSLAIGCYLIGSATGIVGFALGSRGFFSRPGSDPEVDAERQDRRAVAAVLMVAGVALVLVGTAIDPHAQLV